MEITEFKTFVINLAIEIEEEVKVEKIGFNKKAWEQLHKNDREDVLREYIRKLVCMKVSELLLERCVEGASLWEEDEDEGEDEEPAKVYPLLTLEELIEKGVEFPEALWRVCEQFPLLNSDELTAEYDRANQ
jgi:hypothetical protein